jgi:hypothetical protein
MIVIASIRAAVWEHLNSRRHYREGVRDVCSSLSLVNEIFEERRRQQKINGKISQRLVLDTEGEAMHVSSVSPKFFSDDTHQSNEENLVFLATYLPSCTVSHCLRSLCSSPSAEKELDVYMQQMFRESFERNLRDPALGEKLSRLTTSRPSSADGKTFDPDGTIHHYPHLSRTEREICEWKALNSTDVKVGSLVEFVRNHQHMGRVVTAEHRKSITLILPNTMKSKEREML